MFDNLSLGDPQRAGIGLVQQWSMSCNAAMTLTLRGNYDPIFALNLRQRNMDIGGAYADDPDALNPNQADLERSMLETDYTGAWTGMPRKGKAVPWSALDGIGGPADDLLNALVDTTGLSFQPRILGQAWESLATLDAALVEGIQVPVIVGTAQEPFMHYVLAMRRHEDQGRVHYQFRDPGGGTFWVSAEDIASGRMPGEYNLITALEVPSVAPAPAAGPVASAPATAAPGMAKKGRRDREGRAKDRARRERRNEDDEELEAEVEVVEAESVETAPTRTVPYGMKEHQFVRFAGALHDGMEAAGYRGVEAVMQGTGASNQSYEQGREFDDGRVSDYDVLIVSDLLAAAAQAQRIPLNGALRDADIAMLRLGPLQDELARMVERPVNFLVVRATADPESGEQAEAARQEILSRTGIPIPRP